MLDHGLLDELHVWLHPLLVGDTDPHNHIGAVGAASRWQLDDVRRHDSGLVILSYRQPEARAGRERAGLICAWPGCIVR